MKRLSPEEAISILSDMKVDIPVPKAAVTQIKRNVALDMAISALRCSEIPNSSDCISRKTAKLKVARVIWEDGDSCYDFHDKCVDCLDDVPPTQPEIVRCKDCRWKQGSECVRFADVRPFPDDFCSRAERRTDGRD